MEVVEGPVVLSVSRRRRSPTSTHPRTITKAVGINRTRLPRCAHRTAWRPPPPASANPTSPKVFAPVASATSTTKNATARLRTAQPTRRTDVADGFLRSIAYSGTAPRGADEASEASAATFASRATSAYTAVPTAHGQSRMQEREVSLRELQAAKKHGTATPAGDGCWKYEYDGVVYVTDATQKRVITTYRAEPSPAPRELGDFARLRL